MAVCGVKGNKLSFGAQCVPPGVGIMEASN